MIEPDAFLDSVSHQFRNQRRLDLLKTFLLHLCTILILCYWSSGLELFYFPPALLFWVTFSVILSLLHQYTHLRTLKHYFHRDLIVQLWRLPLYLIVGSFCVSFFVFFLSHLYGRADLWRQLLQLPLAPFSRLLYVYFAMLLLSGSFLFFELATIWIPRLRPLHFNSKAQIKARKTLLTLVVCFILGIGHLVMVTPENIVYIQALTLSGWGGNPKKAIELFSMIKPKHERLYMNSCYRVGRLLKRNGKHHEAISWFAKIIANPQSSLIDDALLQTLGSQIKLELPLTQLYHTIEQLKIKQSSLFDEALLKYAERLVLLKDYQQAENIYSELSNLPAFTFSVFTDHNHNSIHFIQTRGYALEKQEQLRMLEKSQN